MTKNYDTKDLGLDVDCPVCFKRMLNSYDLKYNYDYGICSSCWVTYLENKNEVMNKKLAEAGIDKIEDSIARRDKIREVYVQTAKELKSKQEEYIKLLASQEDEV